MIRGATLDPATLVAPARFPEHGVDLPTGMPEALLREIGAAMARVAAGDEARHVITLTGMPMGPVDRQVLADTLGRGEVRAEIDAGGRTDIHETRFSGVWWVSDRDDGGKTSAEYIEIARVPALMLADTEDIAGDSAALIAALDARAEAAADTPQKSARPRKLPARTPPSQEDRQ